MKCKARSDGNSKKEQEKRMSKIRLKENWMIEIKMIANNGEKEIIIGLNNIQYWKKIWQKMNEVNLKVKLNYRDNNV